MLIRTKTYNATSGEESTRLFRTIQLDFIHYLAQQANVIPVKSSTQHLMSIRNGYINGLIHLKCDNFDMMYDSNDQSAHCY